VLGYVDGTLIKITPPSLEENRQIYYCRKGYTALNAHVVSTALLRKDWCLQNTCLCHIKKLYSVEIVFSDFRWLMLTLIYWTSMFGIQDQLQTRTSTVLVDCEML